MAGDKCEVHRGALAIGFGLGLEEIGIAVDEHQAVTAAAAQREHRPQQDRAIAAEHNRKVPGIEHFGDRVSQARRPVHDRLSIQHPRFRIGTALLRRDRQAAGATSADPVCETEAEQLLRKARNAVTPQAERRWGFDNGVAA
jgi:hypothetical protein